jgi:hypothetical protein
VQGVRCGQTACHKNHSCPKPRLFKSICVVRGFVPLATQSAPIVAFPETN